MFLALAGCKKETNPLEPKVIPASGGQDVMPTDGTDVVRIDPKAPQFTSAERKFNGNGNSGTNGNGNGNNTNQNVDTTSVWVINEHVQNWNVTWDTSVCGFFIMRWDAVKPATTNMLDPVYISDYGIAVDPMPSNCGSVAICLTNLFWTKYGSTCAVTPNSTLRIRVGWARYDNVNKVCDKYFSEWVTVRTGQRIDQCSN